MNRRKIFVLLPAIMCIILGTKVFAQEKTIVISNDSLNKLIKGIRVPTSGIRAEDLARAYAFSADHNLRSLGWASVLSQDKGTSQLSMRKNFENESLSKKTTFPVEESSNFVSFSVAGECREGEIRIIIKNPAGKLLQEVVIDPSAMIEWSQSLPVTKFQKITTESRSKTDPFQVEKNKELIGNWQIEISAKNAKGHYALKISTR